MIVGIESYGFVPPVPGAEPNAKAWYDYLTRTRGAAPGSVKLLLGVDATREDMLDAAQAAAAKAGPDGRLWFVFIGHGAPSADGSDGLLVGVDAQQKAESLQKRSLRRGDLLAALAKTRAGSISVILDACFSGRGPDGAGIAPGLQPLVTVEAKGAVDPRITVLTAARGDQFAGALPGTRRPAFSYLTLGALRGWAAGSDGRVTAGAVWRYATSALDATLRGRNQTPDLIGAEGAVIGASAGEKGPDLAALAKATAGGGADFQVSSLPSVPPAQAPKALDAAATALDLGGVDVDALEKFDAASELDKGTSPAEEKAARWRALAKDAPKFAELAEKRAAQWDRYAAEWKAGEDARIKRTEARDADWAKLSRLLTLNVVAAKDKERWAAKFAQAYLESPGVTPAAAAALIKHVPAGSVREALAKTAESGPLVPDVFKVKFATTKGDMLVEVHRSWAPIGADRFHALVSDGFFDGAAFFRVIKGFMAQTGLHGDPAVSAKWNNRSLKDDPANGQSNKVGYVTFAKTGAPDSRTTQIFFNIVDNKFLDGQGFVPFGKVVENAWVLSGLYAEYGEAPDQGTIASQGNAYLKASYPRLDYIKTARIVP